MSFNIIKGDGLVGGPSPPDGYFLAWDTTTGVWLAKPAPFGAFSADGDLSGDNTSQVVIGIHGRPIANTAPSDGDVYTWNTLTSQWEPMPPSGSGFIADGDLDGSDILQTVIGIQGRLVVNTAPNNGDIYVWNSGTSRWVPTAQSIFSAGGDLSGTLSSQTVIRINGATVPAAGVLTIGNVLRVSGGSSLTYSPVNLAGGSGWVTGVLPAINQANQSLGGDLTGTTASASVLRVNGVSVPPSPSVNELLVAVNGTSAMWSQIYDGYIANTANIAGTKIAGATAVTRGTIQITGDLSGTFTSPIVSGIQGVEVDTTDLADGYIFKYSVVDNAWLTVPAPSGTFIAGGDLFGTTSNQTVVGIQQNPILSQVLGALDDGYVLTWDGGAGNWLALPPTGGGGGGFTAGGDLSGTSTNQVVIRINGATVPVSGSLTTGNILQVNGVSSLTYGPLNLAGGSNYVTGVLPAGNQAAQSLGGDLTGSTSVATVLKVNGTSVPANPSANQMLVALNSTSSIWSQVYDGYVASGANIAGSKIAAATNAARGTIQLARDLGGTATAPNVVGIQGIDVNIAGLQDGYVLKYNATATQWQVGPGPTGSFTAGGDLSGNSSSQTVIAIRGNPVQALTLGSTQDGYVLTWVNASTQWQAKPATGGSGFTAGGDLSGTSTSQTVIRINGATVPVAGSLNTGNVLQVNGASSLTYGPINLAGGASYVTGVLPTGNQAAQSLGGDLTGSTTLATVLAINGTSVQPTPSANQILVAVNSSSSMWSQIYDGYVAVGANITGTKIAGATSGTRGTVQLTRDLGGTATAPTVVGLQGVNLDVTGLQDGYVISYNAAGTTWKVGPAPSGSFTASGDLSGNSSSQTVIRIQGNPVQALTLGSTQDGYVLTWVNGSSQWQAKPAGGSGFTPGGDLSGTSTSQTVIRVNGATVPAAGSLATGNVLQVDGASSLTYGPLNLGGGATYVTGTLPAGNQANQSLGGDLTGSTAVATVLRINGTSVPGTPNADEVLVAVNSSSANWAKIADANVASAANIAGSKIAGATTGAVGVVQLAGDLSGTSTSPSVTKIRGNTVAQQTLGASQDGYVLTWSNSDGYWYAKLSTGGGGGGFTAGGDLSGTAVSQQVISLTGSAGTIDIATTGATFNWAAGTTSPTITQANNTTNSATAQALTVRAQNATGTTSTGGNVVLKSGTGTTTPGSVRFEVGSNLAGYFDNNRIFRFGIDAATSLNAFGTTGTFPNTTTTPDSFYSYVANSFNQAVFASGSASNRTLLYVLNTGGGTSATTGLGFFAASSSHATPEYAGNGIIEQFGSATSGLKFAKRLGDNTGFAATGTIWQSGAWSVGNAVNQDTSSEAQAGLTGPLLNIGTTTGGTLASTSNQALVYNSAGTATVQGHAGHNFVTNTTSIASTSTSKFITNQGRRIKTTVVTGNYTVLTTDEVIMVGAITGSITITLPSSPTAGDTYVIKDQNGNATTYDVIVSGNGSNIDGSASFTIDESYASITLVYGNSSWGII